MSTISTNICGYVAPNWENVRTAFEENLIDGLDIGASLSIYYRGECVVDLYGGWKDIERKNDYDTPIAKYWPEFGVNGKEVGLNR
jgi:hypothetical protein